MERDRIVDDPAQTERRDHPSYYGIFRIRSATSSETRRASKTVVYIWPSNASNITSERAKGCTGVMSLRPSELSVIIER